MELNTTQASQDFEAFFVQMFLKEMRPKNTLGGAFLNAGMSEEVFYDFFEEAVAKEMAKSQNNFGIADAVNQQMFE